MSIVEILMRSISGYIFIIPGIILYFGALRKSAKRQTPLHITTAFIFCYYLIGILTMTGIGKLKAFDPTLVLVPFRDMISGPIDTMLNIILFVPLGFFLPLLYKKYRHIGSVALVGFLLSLSIEIVQMFGRGATDINDLITNTVGACLGFFIYQLLSKLASKEFIKIIYVFLTIFLYLLKCPQSLILSALRAFCFCGKPRISRSIFLYFPCQSWLKSW